MLIISAALELLSPLKNPVPPPFSRRDEGCCGLEWEGSRWPSRGMSLGPGMSRGCALSAEWLRTAEDIISLKDRSACDTGAVLKGARG